MCGIAGIISKNRIDTVSRRSVGRMINALVHRGPDGQGQFEDDNVVIGMRRLSIIDLTGGWQPIYNEDKNLALIVNGEVYNYIELTETLKVKGHTFSTHSDSEVILHLYEEYNEDCLCHLRGMFAFALYDRKNKTFMIARDRMGEKPLYLYQTEDSILFSSEIKSLLSSGIVPFELDPAAVNEYFHYQYVPEPKTPLKSIRKLPRAHYLKIGLKGWRIEECKYWDMEDSPPVSGNPAELIGAELDKISRIIIRSDVPVGIALSGGLDSSAIAALSAKKYPGIMHAFSVGYPGRPSNDERNDAKVLADTLSMPFHEIELETAELVRNFEKLNFYRDDPIADISGFGYYSVNKAAREHGVPVLLQGQGGDELFWGYQWVKDAVVKTEDMLKSSKPPTGNLLRSFLRKLLGNKTEPRSQPGTYRPVFHEMAPDFHMALSGVRNYYTNDFICALKDSSAFDLFTFQQPWKYSDILITRLISDTYLLENGIAQGDRLSMANSVELRLPFVDYKLVELVIGLRKANQANPDYKRFPKPWLKEAVRGILPDFIIERPKQGFAPPVMEWHTELFNAYGQYLDEGYLVESGVLTKDAGKVLSTGIFPAGAIAPISFKALVLEIWCREMQKVIN